jgi:hypothetical protein
MIQKDSLFLASKLQGLERFLTTFLGWFCGNFELRLQKRWSQI